MPEVVIAAARLGFLVVLWIFVFVALGVVKGDLFGSKRNRGSQGTRPTRQQPPSQPRGRRQKSARTLVVTEGKLTGTRIDLGDEPITIGRANESTLVLTDDYASTAHARLTAREGGWFVEDMGSTNGTYLGQAKVQGPTPVPIGAQIRIGKTVLELRT